MNQIEPTPEELQSAQKLFNKQRAESHGGFMMPAWHELQQAVRNTWLEEARKRIARTKS